MLTPGAPAPRQQSPVTCGAACLVVARMILDPDFAQSIVGPGPVGANARFAAAERAVMRRTNAWRVRGGRVWADLPWPRIFGTSPWGAKAELEAGTGRRYRYRRRRNPASSSGSIAWVKGDAPSLLYVGSRILPRHVVLVVEGPDGRVLYEPARGVVFACGSDTGPFGVDVPRPAFGGWTTVWWSVEPG